MLLLEFGRYFKVKRFSFLSKVGFQLVKWASYRFRGLYLYTIKVFLLSSAFKNRAEPQLDEKSPTNCTSTVTHP